MYIWKDWVGPIVMIALLKFNSYQILLYMHSVKLFQMLILLAW